MVSVSLSVRVCIAVYAHLFFGFGLVPFRVCQGVREELNAGSMPFVIANTGQDPTLVELYSCVFT